MQGLENKSWYFNGKIAGFHNQNAASHMSRKCNKLPVKSQFLLCKKIWSVAKI